MLNLKSQRQNSQLNSPLIATSVLFATETSEPPLHLSLYLLYYHFNTSFLSFNKPSKPDLCITLLSHRGFTLDSQIYIPLEKIM